MTITFDAVKQLQAVNYSISDNAEMAILDMLQGAYWKNGFFKTGDILGEKVLYQATYEGTFFIKFISRKGRSNMKKNLVEYFFEHNIYGKRGCYGRNL